MSKDEKRFKSWIFYLITATVLLYSVPAILVLLAAGLGLAMSLSYGFMIGLCFFTYRYKMTDYADAFMATAEVQYPNWSRYLDRIEEGLKRRKTLKESRRKLREINYKSKYIGRRYRWLKFRASIGLISRDEYNGRSDYLLNELELLSGALDVIEARRISGE